MFEAKVDDCRVLLAVHLILFSGIQGLEPRRNFQPFIGLVRVKEFISGILRIHIIQSACPNAVRVLVSGKYENNI